MKNIKSQFKEPQKSPSRGEGHRHLTVKLLKTRDKVKLLKATREKKKYRRTKLRKTSDFSTEKLQGRMKWNGIIKVLQAKTVYEEFIHTEIIF